MMADVLLVVTLIIYAIYRMNVVGVNLASLITTSAVITGVIAFSLQEMLGNLWGGIALQADNTCRIGDWIRVDGVVGQIIGIRWRCLAVATNDGETVMMPNAQLVKSRVTVLARRGDRKIPWRRPVEFFVGYDARRRGSSRRSKRRSRAPKSRMSPPTPRAICTCRSFDDNSIRYAVLYWLTDLRYDQVTDSQIRAHIYATLARHHMEMPLPHRVLLTPEAVPRSTKRRPRAQLAESPGRAVAPQAVRRIDRRRAPRARGGIERRALRGGRRDLARRRRLGLAVHPGVGQRRRSAATARRPGRAQAPGGPDGARIISARWAC